VCSVLFTAMVRTTSFGGIVWRRRAAAVQRAAAWRAPRTMAAGGHAGRPTSTAGCCERFERFRRHERQRGSRRPLATLRMMGSSRLRRRFHEHGGALGAAVAPRSRISRSLPSHQHPRPVHHSLPSREPPHLPAAAARASARATQTLRVHTYRVKVILVYKAAGRG
jgi:hypothetical protein